VRSMSKSVPTPEFAYSGELPNHAEPLRVGAITFHGFGFLNDITCVHVAGRLINKKFLL